MYLLGNKLVRYSVYSMFGIYRGYIGKCYGEYLVHLMTLIILVFSVLLNLYSTIGLYKNGEHYKYSYWVKHLVSSSRYWTVHF